MLKVAVLFGGKSTEHDISIISGTSVISNMDKNKYKIYPIYIDKNGVFYRCNKKVIKFAERTKQKRIISNIISYLKKMDVVFPVLHGINGEDGTIQGLLQIINVPYVGCDVLSSALCMDKIYTKIIAEKAKILQTKYICIEKYKDKYIYINEDFDELFLSANELINLVKEKLNYPMFIKPSKSGSSVGINKCLSEDNLINYIEYAFEFDNKVIIEEGVNGREVECAILGNNDLLVSNVGEIISGEDFYSFDSKYKNKESYTIIPADLDEDINNNIKYIAKKVYVACGCKGLSRIDFFIENNTKRILLNEINTLPGFTEISMYPKLLENIGISFVELIDKLIQNALE